MSLTINGATNTLTAASGLTVAGNTAVTGTLSATGAISSSVAGGRAIKADNVTDTAQTQMEVSNTNGRYEAGVLTSGSSYAGSITAGGSFSLYANNAAVAVVSPTGLAVTGTLSASGITSVTDVTDATSTTAASLKTAGGLGVAKAAYFGSIVDVSSTAPEINITRYVAATGGPAIYLRHSRGASVGVNTILSAGDRIGTLIFDAANGTGFSNAAYIGADVDGTPGASNDMPGRLVFLTSADGSATPTERMRLDSTGQLSISTTTDSSSTATGALVVSGGVGIAKKLYIGDNIVMASGKGIDFSATADGSGTTTSEVLSDYEEGTWTPVLTFATPGDLSVSYTYQTGKYTKVGRLVTAQFVISTSAFTHTTASSYLNITGLPFAAPGTQDQGQGTVSFGGITKANYTYFTLSPQPSGTYLYMTACAQGQANSNVLAADCPTGTAKLLYGSLTYHV
jgi:hypothetical protein